MKCVCLVEVEDETTTNRIVVAHEGNPKSSEKFRYGELNPGLDGESVAS